MSGETGIESYLTENRSPRVSLQDNNDYRPATERKSDGRDSGKLDPQHTNTTIYARRESDF